MAFVVCVGGNEKLNGWNMGLIKFLKCVFGKRSAVRELTADEMYILGLIQGMYGGHNTERGCFMTPEGGVALFVKDSGGESVVMVHLTNVALFRERSNLSDKQIEEEWLVNPV